MSKRAPIPTEPSPLALAIRANVERAARGESRLSETFERQHGKQTCRFTYTTMTPEHRSPEDAQGGCGPNGYEVRIDPREFVSGSSAPPAQIRFPFLDGIPTADWLECREIERQLG